MLLGERLRHRSLVCEPMKNGHFFACNILLPFQSIKPQKQVKIIKSGLSIRTLAKINYFSENAQFLKAYCGGLFILKNRILLFIAKGHVF